jgi:hypothetical protein
MMLENPYHKVAEKVYLLLEDGAALPSGKGV